MNAGTIITIGVVAAVLLYAVITMIRTAKKGKTSSCGGDCLSCGIACRVQEKEKDSQKK